MRDRCTKKNPSAVVLFTIAAICAALPPQAKSQSAPYLEDVSSEDIAAPSTQLDLDYLRPAHKTKISNYLFDAYGPYPAAGAVLEAGLDQAENSPPEWGKGMEGCGKRFGSEFGTAAVATTTRFALSEILREDTLYYRCECRGILPRISHAAISTVTARRGRDGHRVFSLSAVVAPYVGAMTAVYLWFPDRYNAKDALRIGSYNLLFYMGGNISLEFIYSGPHSLLSRMHMNNKHGAPDPGLNP